MTRRFLLLTTAVTLLLAGCAEPGRTVLEPSGESARQAFSTSIDLTGVLEFATLPDLTSARHAEAWIVAAEGGTVELHGFRVDIPAGALPADTLVTIDLPSDPILGKRVLAEFGPHGIQFNTPVTLTFPLAGVLVPPQGAEGARWENGAWTPLGGWLSADGLSLHATTPRFSEYAARGKDVMAGG